MEKSHKKVEPGISTGKYTKTGDAIYFTERETKEGVKRTHFIIKPGPIKSYVSKKIMEKLNLPLVNDDVSRSRTDIGNTRG